MATERVLRLSVDDVVLLGREVDAGRMSVLEFGQHAVAASIETEWGWQPAFFPLGSATARKGWQPTVPYTRFRDQNNPYGDAKILLPSGKGLVVRAGDSPVLAVHAGAVGDPNIFGERIATGGLGVEDNWRGIGGWNQLSDGQVVRRLDPVAYRILQEDVSAQVGYLHIVRNDGSFQPLVAPYEPEGQYVSPRSHDAIISRRVYARDILGLDGLGNVALQLINTRVS